MFQNNALLLQLKQQMSGSAPHIQGVVKGGDKGFGFIESENQTRYFVPPQYMKKLLPGDRVTALLRSEKGQTFAEPEKLIDPALTRFVARVCKRNGRLAVVPDHHLIMRSISCTDTESDYQDGDWVVATLTHHPLRGDSHFRAQLNEIVAGSQDSFAQWWVTMARHQLERGDPPEISVELVEDTSGRVDLSELPFISIDNASTKDIDDALCVALNPDGSFTLMVAIADPTAYVAPDSEVDATARRRAFTHYLPGVDVPMLPRILGEDSCSLRAGVRRPALVCRMVVDQEGELQEGASFCLAWIVSKAQLNYSEVSDWLEGETSWQPENSTVIDEIRALFKLAELRTSWRQRNAILFRERPEYRFILDEACNVVDVVAETRRVAHRMVEEAMILANFCAANLLQDRLGYGIFNVHPGLDPNQMEPILAILSDCGSGLGSDAVTTLQGFCELQRHLGEQPTAAYWAGRLRRYQQHSIFSSAPAAHYGLGLPVYATWSSPIRKYGDMVNHRLIKAIINKSQPPSRPDEELIMHLNERRRQHRVAERQLADFLYGRFLQGESDGRIPIEAEIIDVTRGGLRARLLSNGATVFLPNGMLHPVRENLIYNQERATLSIKGVDVYRLGDRIMVVLAKVSPEARNIIASPAA